MRDLTLHIETKASRLPPVVSHPEITPTQTPAVASPAAVWRGVDVPVRPILTQGGHSVRHCPICPKNEVVAEREKWVSIPDGSQISSDQNRLREALDGCSSNGPERFDYRS